MSHFLYEAARGSETLFPTGLALESMSRGDSHFSQKTTVVVKRLQVDA